jgi:hypothetical protein
MRTRRVFYEEFMAAMKARKGHTGIKGHADTKEMPKKKMSSTQGKGVQESGEKKHKMKKGAKMARPK